MEPKTDDKLFRSISIGVTLLVVIIIVGFVAAHYLTSHAYKPPQSTPAHVGMNFRGEPLRAA
jgi:hypothetical protein